MNSTRTVGIDPMLDEEIARDGSRHRIVKAIVVGTKFSRGQLIRQQATSSVANYGTIGFLAVLYRKVFGQTVAEA